MPKRDRALWGAMLVCAVSAVVMVAALVGRGGALYDQALAVPAPEALGAVVGGLLAARFAGKVFSRPRPRISQR